VGLSRGHMGGFPVKPAVNYGGQIWNAEQRGAARRYSSPELPRHHPEITISRAPTRPEPWDHVA
jgi:hypothetical protein